MDATHVHCPRCNSFEPMVWDWVKIVRPRVGGDSVRFDTFEGGAVRCRTCQFEITKIVRLH